MQPRCWGSDARWSVRQKLGCAPAFGESLRARLAALAALSSRSRQRSTDRVTDLFICTACQISSVSLRGTNVPRGTDEGAGGGSPGGAGVETSSRISANTARNTGFSLKQGRTALSLRQPMIRLEPLKPLLGRVRLQND